MSDYQRAGLSPPQTRPLSKQPGRKLVISCLVLLIVTAMIVWFGLLGWGVLEMFKWFRESIRVVFSAGV